MTDQESVAFWNKIQTILDEQLQYGFLEQAKSIVDIKLEGSHLTLTVSTDEAYDFFNSELNKQRLLIVSRQVAALEEIEVIKVEAEPLT